MNRAPTGISSFRWGPYAVAGVFLLADYLWLARGLSYLGPHYQVWSLNRGTYSDVLNLSVDHYLRPDHVIHPVPYLHDRIEYPILLGFALWWPTWLPGGPPTWFAAAGVMVAAATFGSIALVRRRSPASAWWIAASPALLLDAGINWDLIGIFFLVGGVVWFGEQRYRLSGASTALGTFFKLFPVVVAPMALSALGSRWWRSADPSIRPGERGPGPEQREQPDQPGEPPARPPATAFARWLVPFAVVSAVVAGPFLLLAPSNTLWFIRFNSLRPQKDSIWELLSRVLGTSLVSSHNINSASFLLVMAAMAYGAWMVWHTPAPGQVRAVTVATTMVIIVWMGVNKVWNPQYILWVFAAGALASPPARFGVALGALAVYDSTFEFVLRRPDQTNSFSWVGYGSVVARSVIFVLMVVWAVGELRRREPVPLEDPVEGTHARARS